MAPRDDSPSRADRARKRYAKASAADEAMRRAVTPPALGVDNEAQYRASFTPQHLKQMDKQQGPLMGRPGPSDDDLMNAALEAAAAGGSFSEAGPASANHAPPGTFPRRRRRIGER